MKIRIIQSPYDSGRKNYRMGLGPGYFIYNGIVERLREDGHDVDLRRIEVKPEFTAEIATAFEVNRLIAMHVKSAVDNQMFPLVLSGNCNSSIGSIGGVGSDGLGLIWFDTHGDFNTPETTSTGFLDGMGLAMITGRCWKTILKTVPGFEPVPESNVIHAGSRELDFEEEKAFERSDIILVRKSGEDESILGTFDSALEKLQSRVEKVYLHIDLDVMDTMQGCSNHLASPGGLLEDEMEGAVRMIKDRFTLCGCSIAAYDPAYDESGAVMGAGIRIMQAVAG